MGIGSGALESVVMNRGFWSGKRVFLTGHTGFKGGWLALTLLDFGAEVHGYALAPSTEPNFLTVCGVPARLRTNTIADIRNAAILTHALEAARPDVVLHLAAQSLVRYSYVEPVETYAVNVMGTVTLLEALRRTPSVKAAVVVTSDKCYENREWSKRYQEGDALGGHDPYSSSKACAEIVTAAYRRSFLESAGVHIASARAGNVIGGGDWAPDRLVPDFLRAVDASQPLTVRSPDATRPWQHVLEPLSGYLTLAEKLFTEGAAYAEEWNFGPKESDAKPVRWLVEELCASVPGATWQCETSPRPHEATELSVDSSKANVRLGWHPRWDLKTSLLKTLEWCQAWKHGADMYVFSLDQLHEYEAAHRLGSA